jgi:hypothetical protein
MYSLAIERIETFTIYLPTHRYLRRFLPDPRAFHRHRSHCLRLRQKRDRSLLSPAPKIVGYTMTNKKNTSWNTYWFFIRMVSTVSVVGFVDLESRIFEQLLETIVFHKALDFGGLNKHN